jgi:molecular chaperone DnaK
MTAIGIDLGTSNTVVAHFKDGDPITLCDEAGRRLIPSIVSFHPSGSVLVGDAAKMRRYNDGVSTVTGAKRLMGRAWGSPELEEMRKRIPYELREGRNKTVRALLRGELYTIPELSAFVLRKAKAWAEAAIGSPVTEAVITVPANFNELQRQATKLAGELAGLEVMRVLNEPTAAALAYGHIAPAVRDEQIAVYDFGGGTFDLTMLRMSERELRVRATAGDMFLGGDDIDLAIAGKIADAYLKQHRYDPRADEEVFARLRVAAERIKVELSTVTEYTFPLNELMYGPGGKPIHWSFTMTRKELDTILDPFVNRSLKVCEDALELLKAAPRDFDRIVLVGGSTLSPRIRQRVTDFFGREPVDGVDPEEAVALGAAISGTIPVARKAKPATAASPAAPEVQPAPAPAPAPVPAAAAATPVARVSPGRRLGVSLVTGTDYPVSQRFGPAPGATDSGPRLVQLMPAAPPSGPSSSSPSSSSPPSPPVSTVAASADKPTRAAAPTAAQPTKGTMAASGPTPSSRRPLVLASILVLALLVVAGLYFAPRMAHQDVGPPPATQP